MSCGACANKTKVGAASATGAPTATGGLGNPRHCPVCGKFVLNEVVVTYKDCLTRFGFEYLHALFLTCGVRMTVLNADETVSPEKELTDDLIAIITSFSGRLYGMRSHKQKELVKCAKQALKP